MKYSLISPRLAIQRGDFLGSGVPYWPLELAVFAGFLREAGHAVEVHDLFGLSPQSLELDGDIYWQGQKLQTEKLDLSDETVFVVFAISYMSHQEVLSIVRELRHGNSSARILVLENSQAVTAYSLREMKDSLFAAGASGLILGEPYLNWLEIEKWLTGGLQPQNLLTPEGQSSDFKGQALLAKVPKYPVPAWDLFPYKNYWKLPYSHGPKSKTYFPMLTSRGCPYPCQFCVVPSTNEQKWRARSPEDVVAEMNALHKIFGVCDFQIEDLNPTIQANRWRKISELLIAQGSPYRFYFVSGTKAETVPVDDVPTLAKGGCRYISISPESGSEVIMKAIGKPFDYEHGLKLVEACHKNGIYTQACFLAGYPGETAADHKKSCDYLRQLVRNGLDEAAIFIVSPFAGSQLFKTDKIALSDRSNLVSFSPKGRDNYDQLVARRSELILIFFKEKLRGMAIWWQGLRALFGVPRTKMENLPKRMLYVWRLVLANRIRPT